jgi:ribosomal protein L37AE/L43A
MDDQAIQCPQCDSHDVQPASPIQWECKECDCSFTVKLSQPSGSGQLAGKVYRRGMKWGAGLV